MIQKGVCGAPGPYGAHCTDDRAIHDFSCYDSSKDVSFNARTMEEEDIPHYPCSESNCYLFVNPDMQKLEERYVELEKKVNQTTKYVVKRRYIQDGVETNTIISGPLSEADANRYSRALSQDYQSTQYYTEPLNPGQGLIPK